MTKAIYSVTSNRAPTKKEKEFLGDTVMWAAENEILNIKWIKDNPMINSSEQTYTYYITIYAKTKEDCEHQLDGQIYDGIFENWKITEQIKLIIRKSI